jgi:hypothetical protein
MEYSPGENPGAPKVSAQEWLLLDSRDSGIGEGGKESTCVSYSVYEESDFRSHQAIVKSCVPIHGPSFAGLAMD